MTEAKIFVRSGVVRSLLNNRNFPVESFSRKSGVSLSKLNSILSQDSEIEFSAAVAMANAISKPWTIFLLDSPEKPPEYGQDHRTIANGQHKFSPEVVRILQEANYILDVAEDISPGTATKLPIVTSTEKNNPTLLASKMRDFLGVSFEVQRELNNSYKALRYWKDLIQKKGIYIAEKPLPIDDVRAFSLRRKTKSIIVISTKDFVYPRIFSIFHELCHIMLKDEGVCDLNELAINNIEPFCNAFSSSFLIPEEEFIGILRDMGFGKGDFLREEDTKFIVRTFQVSKLAIYTRLKILGYISQQDYSKIYEESVESSQKNKSKLKGGNYYSNIINSSGKLFSQEIFQANAEGKVSFEDIGRVLGVSSKNVEKLREALFSRK